MQHISKIIAAFIMSAVATPIIPPSNAAALSVEPVSIESSEIQKNTTRNPQDAPNKKLASWIEIPEPSNLFMLALGITGLVAGRYVAGRNRKS